MTTLEEVAAAIALKLSEHNFVAGPLDCLPLARAAIEAVRKPSEAQYEALSATNLIWRELNSAKVWEVYVDAILNESPR